MEILRDVLLSHFVTAKIYLETFPSYLWEFTDLAVYIVIEELCPEWKQRDACGLLKDHFNFCKCHATV